MNASALLRSIHGCPSGRRSLSIATLAPAQPLLGPPLGNLIFSRGPYSNQEPRLPQLCRWYMTQINRSGASSGSEHTEAPARILFLAPHSQNRSCRVQRGCPTKTLPTARLRRHQHFLTKTRWEFWEFGQPRRTFLAVPLSASTGTYRTISLQVATLTMSMTS